MEFNVVVPTVPITVSLKFQNADEATELFQQLRTWNSHGQSRVVTTFLQALEYATQKTKARSSGWFMEDSDPDEDL